MFCHNCGSQLPENAMFCTRCGTRISPAPEQEKPQAPAPRTITLPSFHMEKSMLAVLILCAAILFTILIIPAGVVGRNSQTSSTFYYLGECDLPYSIKNETDVEFLARFSAVIILVSLAAIVLCVFKQKNLLAVIAGLACCTISGIDILAFMNAIPEETNWKILPFGPAIIFGCAIPATIMLFVHFKANKAPIENENKE